VRATLVMRVPILAVSSCVVDRYELNARYTGSIWTRVDTAGQNYQGRLKSWRRVHGFG
jgi:hypothetical protein